MNKFSDFGLPVDDIHINCPHFDVCSGCSRNFHVNQPSQFEDALRFFKAIGVPSLQMQTGNPKGWRCRAKLAVRGWSAIPHIGLFQEGSHSVVNIPECQVHCPSINKAVEVLRNWIIKGKIPPYDESTGMGLIRYVQFAVDRSSDLIQVALVINRIEADSNFVDQLKDLWLAYPDLWHSLWLNFNTRRDNIIFGSGWLHLHGLPWLWDSLLGQLICYHPASFAQANPDMFERLLDRIQQLLPANADVLEYYAGVGSIGFAISPNCSKVHCVEINPLSQQCFKETLSRLPENLARRFSFSSGSAATHLHYLDQLNEEQGVVIVDPPRKGLEPLLLKALSENKNIRKMFYVSCGWSSFQKDCIRFLEAGWHIAHAEAFLFFPGSDQIEMLCLFVK